MSHAGEFERLRELAVSGRRQAARAGLEALHHAVAHDAEPAALLAWIASVDRRDAECAHWLAQTYARAPAHLAARTIEVDLLLRQGRAIDAVGVAQSLVRDHGGSVFAHQTLGTARMAAGDMAGAVAAYDAAIALDASHVPAWIARGALRGAAGDLPASIADFEVACRLQPGAREPRIRLALANLQRNDGPAARPILAGLVAEFPADPAAWRGLAEAEELCGRIEPAIAARERAVALDDGHPDQHLQQALMLARFGLVDAAREAAARAALLAPEALLARWLSWQLLPLIYRDEAELARWRVRWREGLSRMEAIDVTPPAVAAQLPEILATVPSFALHYQGGVQLEEQRRHVVLVSRCVARCWPRREIAARGGDGRLRVAFVSAFLRNHTVSKLFRGWIEGLDRERFEVWGAHLGPRADAVSGQIAGAVDHWITGLPTCEAWADALVAAKLDAIVYLDIGMDGLAQVLAAQRLAPLQCAAWGHPVTTGFASIDWFLSAMAMEPIDGERHYLERLERLPGLGVHYPLPARARGYVRARREPAQAPRLLCAQSVFKFLPLHFDLYARIAERVPQARFAFIPHPVRAVRDQLAAAFRDAFARRGLDFDQVATLHPYQDEAAFFDRLAEADVLLDTLEWSGGNTTLEALAMDLPVVTCAGATMRSRHTHAMLALMGLDAELSATDPDHYVEIAVRLATDPGFHARMVDAIALRKPALYAAPDVVPALEAFLLRECGRR